MFPGRRDRELNLGSEIADLFQLTERWNRRLDRIFGGAFDEAADPSAHRPLNSQIGFQLNGQIEAMGVLGTRTPTRRGMIGSTTGH